MWLKSSSRTACESFSSNLFVEALKDGFRVHFNRESITSHYAFAAICLTELKNRSIDFPCSDGPNEFSEL